MRLYRKAVLIVHGFTGSLYDNEYLMNYLEYDREFDVYAKGNFYGRIKLSVLKETKLKVNLIDMKKENFKFDFVI